MPMVEMKMSCAIRKECARCYYDNIDGLVGCEIREANCVYFIFGNLEDYELRRLWSVYSLFCILRAPISY